MNAVRLPARRTARAAAVGALVAAHVVTAALVVAATAHLAVRTYRSRESRP